MKQLKVLKDNKFIDNKLYYLKPADLPVPRFYGQPKIHKPGVPMHPVVSYSGSPLYKVYILWKFIQLYIKIKHKR